MLNLKNDTFSRDLYFLRRLLMLSITNENMFSLHVYNLGSLYSFSLKTPKGEESYPYFFKTLSDMFNEATKFLADYNLKIIDINGQQEEFTIS